MPLLGVLPWICALSRLLAGRASCTLAVVGIGLLPLSSQLLTMILQICHLHVQDVLRGRETYESEWGKLIFINVN